MDPVELMRTRVVCERERISHPSSTDFPGNYPGQDLSWSLAKFKSQFKIVISHLNNTDMELDLISIDAALANAFRRIMISEVPTMAIEKVFVYENDGIMHDEVLAHRLGLIPIQCDIDEFEYRDSEDPNACTDRNTFVFNLRVKCERNPNARKDAVDPEELYLNSSVYSRDLVFQPNGIQADIPDEKKPRVVNPDILITKLRPGQSLDVDVWCHKGIGKDHAKFSPVATASYRLLPDIIIKSPILGDDAEKFASCFPKGVIAVIKNEYGEKEAKVVNPRKDTVSRECLRYPEFKDKVLLTRIRDHFIFSIESTGVIQPHDTFRRSVKILMEKCKLLKRELATLENRGEVTKGKTRVGR